MFYELGGYCCWYSAISSLVLKQKIVNRARLLGIDESNPVIIRASIEIVYTIFGVENSIEYSDFENFLNIEIHDQFQPNLARLLLHTQTIILWGF